jgi:pimeloyl-ACP methyl ester carboxylesterase
LIIPDLRGHGATEKPVAGYDKRTMAGDIRVLMHTLRIERARLSAITATRGW